MVRRRLTHPISGHEAAGESPLRVRCIGWLDVMFAIADPAVRLLVRMSRLAAMIDGASFTNLPPTKA